MGDRGNIVVRQSADTNKGDVWFYTHWSGGEIVQTVTKALARKLRWEDPSYLARIVFDTLTKGDQGAETGFGISTQMQDNEHDILVVDVSHQVVWVIRENELKDSRIPEDYKPKNAVSFSEFIGEPKVVSEVRKARQKAGV